MTLKDIAGKILGKNGVNIYRDLRAIDIHKIPPPPIHNEKPLKLVGFVKCFNEGSNGNLKRCLTHLSMFCDDIVVCDDSSTDNSLEIAKKFTSNIIQMPDDFVCEIAHKQKLLEKALELDPDWIVFLDPDEIFDRNGEIGGIRKLCHYGSKHGIDSFLFRYYDLWQSKEKYRVDGNWSKYWQKKLWRNTGNLQFNVYNGLHRTQSPSGMTNMRRANIKLIHYGFDSDEKIDEKYKKYEHYGQIQPFLSKDNYEPVLELEDFSRDWLPTTAIRISVICLIYKSIDYAKLVFTSFTKYTHPNVTFEFIANDPTPDLLAYLKSSKMNYKLYCNKNPKEYHINRVYRAYNFGGMDSDADVIVFVNSDMIFSPNWLENMIKHLNKNTVVTSRVIESGKAMPIDHAVVNNFGVLTEFDDQAFQKFAKQYAKDGTKNSGGFMPCAIYQDTFKKSGGFPVGPGYVGIRYDTGQQGMPGDRMLFHHILKDMGIKHITSMDSIVYHIMEGEKDS